MTKIAEEIIRFLRDQNFVIVSSIDKNGSPHSSCKDIVEIDHKRSCIYLLDLYKAETVNNLRNNPNISITAVDEHRFKGYCLKGKARLITADKISSEFNKAWEHKISSRITDRLLKNIRQEKGHPLHPEAILPKPQYLIEMKIEEVVDLVPLDIKKGA